MGSSLSNAPTSDWYYMIVIKHNDQYQKQILFKLHSNQQFERTRMNNIWSSFSESETVAGALAKVNAVQTNLNNHTNNKSNPHDTNKSDVGLANVDNVKQASKVEFDAHANNKSNPHNTTKVHVGLGNVDNIQQATKVEFNAHNTDNIRHITSTERSNWNEKATTAVATQSSNGLMSSSDKKVIDMLNSLSTYRPTYKTGFGDYSAGQQIVIETIGSIASITGAFTNANIIEAGAGIIVGILPEGCRPRRDEGMLCQGTGANIFYLTLKPTGEMIMERYRKGGDYHPCGANSWLNVNNAYIIQK